MLPFLFASRPSRWGLPVALLLTAGSPALADDPPFVPFPRPTTAWLKPRLEAVRAEHGLPAIGAAIVVRGRIVAQGVAGYRKEGSPEKATINDAFHLGSITKPMTAALTGVLVQQRRLRWDTTLQQVFPELVPSMQPAYPTVTIAQLLAHVSGMPYQPLTEGPDEFADITPLLVGRRYEYVRAAVLDPPAGTPGTKQAEVYGGGTIIVAAMAERLLDRSWEDLMRRNVFRPLKMSRAGFGAMSSSDIVDGPWEHIVEGGSVVPVPPPPGYESEPHAPAGRNVHCSIGDLARFLVAQLPHGRAGRRLFNARTLAVMHMPVGPDLPCPGWFQGYDYWGGGRAILGHNGSNGRNYACAYVAPGSNAAICVMTNIESGRGSVACEYLAHEIEAAIARRPRSGSQGAFKAARASNVFHGDPRYAAGAALDDRSETRWATDDGVQQAWLEVDLGQRTTFRRAMLSEAVEYGPRVEAFDLQWKEGSEWKTFARGAGIGDVLSRRFPPVTARYVRLNITQAAGPPTIREFQLF